MSPSETWTAEAAQCKVKQATPEEIMKDYNFDLERVKCVTYRNEKYSWEIHESVPS